MMKSVNLLANEILFGLKRLYGAENDPARDGDAIAIISEPLRVERAENERLRTREYALRAGLHTARGALLGIGTDYAKEIADHLAGVLDPTLSPAPRTAAKEDRD